ncbi:hypothetical protein EIN_185770 [Entamoeba invadens IP1]|uniref:hypothetical protein n=1 Tax=Entamoeba invadens IP1 TaxID=370355 RepID=UPI0002C3D208|nr:hypothetical protein EIN_185770 [Entamoeba invadens IP1]ELP94170.1 hypothetical protein EIN_185770 [Entamoeba invadens IP1]|eukprot:XP_004260941.1 hypothetical protein EIN_185770 [Entamoeba invadens IP1]
MEYTLVSQILSEKDILYNIKTCFIGDPSTNDDRKALIWNCFKSDTSLPPEDMSQVLSMTLNIKDKIGRVTLQNYDNFVSRGASYFPFKGVSLAVVVFNSQDDSYKNVKNWYSEVNRYCGASESLQTLIIGIFPDNSYHDFIPDNIKKAIENIPRSTFFYFDANAGVHFRETFFRLIVNIRDSLFSDLKLVELEAKKERQAMAKKKPKVVTSTNLSSALSRKMKLVTKNDAEFFVLIKCIALGDEGTSSSCHRVVQHILDLPEAVGDDIEDYVCVPQHMIQKDAVTIKLKIDVYNHSIPSGKSYTPYFNTLVGIIVFRHDDRESFKNVVNWYQETQRYSNLQSNHYFIVGCDYKETTPVITEEDVKNLIGYISKQKPIEYFRADGRNWEQLKERFFDLIDEVYTEEFTPEFLEQCSNSNVVRNTIGQGQPPGLQQPQTQQYKPFVIDEETPITGVGDEEGGSLLGNHRHEEMEYEAKSTCCCNVV